MPLYMDRHDAREQVSARDVALSHIRDIEVQEKYDVRYITYWFDYDTQSVFCLVDAPDKETANAVHDEAHGQVASEIIEVNWGAVQEFLGKIREPKPGEIWEETAFRTIMFTDIEGSTDLTQRLGDDAAMTHIRQHNDIIRRALHALSGREIKHTGDGIMACFPSVVRAIECAITIQRSFRDHNHGAGEVPLRVRIGMSAGEPVQEHEDLFGATVQLARRICDAGDVDRILVSNVVRELCIGKGFQFEERGEATLKGFPEPVRLFEVIWQ